MKSCDVKVRQDGQIFEHNRFIGFIDEDKVYVMTKRGAHEIGAYDHRSEIVPLIVDWYSKEHD